MNDSAKTRKKATRSCGCYQKDACREYFEHREKRDYSAYECWASMIARCYRQTQISYPLYGAKGVTVCQRWRDSYDAFLEDMGTRPSREHTLDRYPDKNGNYEPGNVRWATPLEQARNKSRNHLLTFRGETKCIDEWAAILGLSPKMIYKRLRRGWSDEKALTTTARVTSGCHRSIKLTDSKVREIRARYAAGGVLQSTLAREFGVSKSMISQICLGNTWTHVE